tara:strand:+ start:23 stop:781 length:759 start_codon:yes stop_codon:yes gene_type:complete
MFHEIWIGAYPSAKWKERWQGGRQKREILKFLDHAQPQNVHSTNCAALDRLSEAGIDARHLYLFGNIPYAPVEETGSRRAKDNELKVAFFGTLYNSFPYPLLSERLLEISKKHKRTVRMLIMGRHREQGGLQSLKMESSKHGFELELTGELSTQTISHRLQECTLGVSTTPFDIIGKSGATSALLEHGLPVLAYDDGDTPEDRLFVFEPFGDQVFLLNDPSLQIQLTEHMTKAKPAFFNGVKHTAQSMLKSL